MRKALMSLTVAASLMLPVGCAHKTVQAPIPGSINSFDSTAYQTLRTAHDMAKSLSDQAKAGTFKPSPVEKVAINQFIADLNTADTVYAAYHNGSATQAAAEKAINQVTADQAALPVGGK